MMLTSMKKIKVDDDQDQDDDDQSQHSQESVISYQQPQELANENRPRHLENYRNFMYDLNNKELFFIFNMTEKKSIHELHEKGLVYIHLNCENAQFPVKFVNHAHELPSTYIDTMMLLMIKFINIGHSPVYIDMALSCRLSGAYDMLNLNNSRQVKELEDLSRRVINSVNDCLERLFAAVRQVTTVATNITQGANGVVEKICEITSTVKAPTKDTVPDAQRGDGQEVEFKVGNELLRLRFSNGKWMVVKPVPKSMTDGAKLLGNMFVQNPSLYGPHMQLIALNNFIIEDGRFKEKIIEN